MNYIYGKSTHSTKKGFTLVEVVIAIAVFTLLSSVMFGSILSYSSMNTQERLVATESIKTQKIIEEIQIFSRRSTQEIKLVDESDSNKKLYILEDVGVDRDTEHIISILLKDEVLSINGREKSKYIKNIGISLSDDGQFMVFTLESLIPRVPTLTKSLSLRSQFVGD